MLVYMAGRVPMGREMLERIFGDVGVEPEKLRSCVPLGEELVGRLALLSRCDAILLPEDWRADERTRIEKAVADHLRIPQVSYYLPRAKRREVSGREG